MTTDDSPDPELDAAINAAFDARGAEIDAYHRRVGAYIAIAAEADSKLTTVVALTTSRQDFERVKRLVINRASDVKLRMLKDVLPDDWRGGVLLVAAIRRMNEYRNRLAHSVVDLNMESLARNDFDGMYWEHSREKDETPRRVDIDELSREDQHARALTGVLALLAFALHMGNLKIDQPADLRDELVPVIARFSGIATVEQLDMILPH